jgi:hypothetical protein
MPPGPPFVVSVAVRHVKFKMPESVAAWNDAKRPGFAPLQFMVRTLNVCLGDMKDPSTVQIACDTVDVERMVANVLLDACGQDTELVAVIESGDGWNVFVRTEKRRLKVFPLRPGTPPAMRSAIKIAVER